MSVPPLPRFARWLLSRYAPAEWRDSIAGDLEEERRRRLRAGRRAGTWWASAAALRTSVALRWARRDAGAVVVPERRRRVMDGLWADVQQSARGLVKSRGYAFAAVITLALGIGANAAVFDLSNWLLLRPLPGVRAQRELVTLGFTSGASMGARAPISVVDLEALKTGVTSLSGLAGYQSFSLHVAPGGGVPRRIDAEVVSTGYFDVLDGAVTVGRAFSDDEGKNPGAAPVAIVSHRLWTADLGADPAVLGRTIAVNGHPFAVVGVTARGFHGTTLGGATDVWIPIAQHRLALPQYPATVLTSRSSTVLFGLVGRLEPGASVETVVAEANAVRTRIADANPKDGRMKKWIFDGHAGVESRPWIQSRISYAMSVLAGVVGLLLVLTAANVANLMLGRATERRAEIATRLALGASRARVARLLIVESLLLSAAAGATALSLVWWMTRALEGTVVLQGLPPLTRPEIDWRVVAFAILVSTVVALSAGVLPALSGSRLDMNAALRQSGRAYTTGRRRLRQVLTAAQVAVSVTLLVGAALLLRSMNARLAIDPGFDPSHALSFSVEPGLQGLAKPQQAVFYRELLDCVRRTPGVGAAGLSWLQPYSQGIADTAFHAADRSDSAEFSANMNMVSPGFFAAIGLPLVQGREFTEREFLRSDPAGGVVILTASLAKRVFPGMPAVGRQIRMSNDGAPVRTVVGVVRDTRQRTTLNPSADTLFEPFGQSFSSGWSSVVVALAGPEDAVVAGLRKAVTEVDSTLPIYDVIRLDRAIARTFADDLLTMRLTVVFAALAMLLAGVGMYGVLARGVTERRREFAVRSALGAGPARIGALVTSEAMRVAAVGLAIGLAATFWLSGFLASRLFGVTRFDPTALVAASGLVAAMILLSAIGPTRRAARLDPASELK